MTISGYSIISLFIGMFTLGFAIGRITGVSAGFEQGKKAVIDWIKNHYNSNLSSSIDTVLNSDENNNETQTNE